MLFGVLLGVTYVAIAVIAHVARLPRWAAALLGALLVGWQLATSIATWRAVDRDDAAEGVAAIGEKPSPSPAFVLLPQKSLDGISGCRCPPKFAGD